MEDNEVIALGTIVLGLFLIVWIVMGYWSSVQNNKYKYEYFKSALEKCEGKK